MEKIKFTDEYHNFLDDVDKMVDYFALSKDEFLSLYSYITESEYDLTTQNLR